MYGPEKIASKIKEIIDRNGPSFIVEELYQVYKELISSEAADEKTAGALLYALVSGVADAAKANKAMSSKVCKFFKFFIGGQNLTTVFRIMGLIERQIFHTVL